MRNPFSLTNIIKLNSHHKYPQIMQRETNWLYVLNYMLHLNSRIDGVKDIQLQQNMAPTQTDQESY